jgi:hypothetical protein
VELNFQLIKEFFGQFKGNLTMQIDPLVHEYILNSTSEQLYLLYMKAFELIEEFRLQYDYTKFVNIITNDNIDNFSKMGIIDDMVQDDLEEIANFHYIYFSLVADLYSKVETISALNTFNRIENVEDIESLLYSTLEPIDICCNILNLYSGESPDFFYAAIDSVDEEFVNGLKNYLKYTETEEVRPIDLEHILLLKKLHEFYGEHKTVAMTFYKNSYIAEYMLISEIKKLLPSDYENWIRECPKDDHIKIAQELLTILMIGYDSYKDPLVYFTKNSSMFIDEKDYPSIFLKLSNMYKDFLVFKEKKGINR